MFGVAFSAARIHDEAKKPIKTLLNIHPQLLSVQSKRLFDDVYCNTIALSGLEFFFLTRKVILTVVGTICTYELVLMQINND